MSSGQKPRTPEHFPRMNDRKGRHEARREARANRWRSEFDDAMAQFAAAAVHGLITRAAA